MLICFEPKQIIESKRLKFILYILQMIDYTIDLKTIIAALAILTTITVAYLSNWWRNRKRLSYEIISDTALLTTAEIISNELKIFYKDVQVRYIRVLIVRIINDGNQPITSKDFEKDLNLTISEESKILSCNVIKKNPENLDISLQYKENILYITPFLLNSRDYIEVKILIDGFVSQLRFDARIIGVSKITKARKSRSWAEKIFKGIFLLTFLIGLFLSITLEGTARYIWIFDTISAGILLLMPVTGFFDDIFNREK